MGDVEGNAVRSHHGTDDVHGEAIGIQRCGRNEACRKEIDNSRVVWPACSLRFAPKRSSHAALIRSQFIAAVGRHSSRRAHCGTSFRGEMRLLRRSHSPPTAASAPSAVAPSPASCRPTSPSASATGSVATAQVCRHRRRNSRGRRQGRFRNGGTESCAS